MLNMVEACSKKCILKEMVCSFFYEINDLLYNFSAKCATSG